MNFKLNNLHFLKNNRTFVLKYKRHEPIKSIEKAFSKGAGLSQN
jgi:hypothetical protein